MVDSFKEFLSETSLSRVLHHTKNTELGTISASRGEHTPVQNKKANKNLEHDLRSHGHSVIHTIGSYVENQGKKDEKRVKEHSLIVLAKKGSPKGELLKHLKHYGEKYKQDAILHKHADEKHASIHITKGENKGEKHDVGSFHANKDNPHGETHLKGGRKATFSEETRFFLNDEHFKLKEKWETMIYTIGNNPDKTFRFSDDTD